jgi:hypothetical protein
MMPTHVAALRERRSVEKVETLESRTESAAERSEGNQIEELSQATNVAPASADLTLETIPPNESCQERSSKEADGSEKSHPSQKALDLSSVALQEQREAAQEDEEFWLDRQEWLVAMENKLHRETGNKDSILRDVTNLAADAREAESDWMGALQQLNVRAELEKQWGQSRDNFNHEMKNYATGLLAPKGFVRKEFSPAIHNYVYELTGTDSFSQAQLKALLGSYEKTIDAARETTELGRLLFAASQKSKLKVEDEDFQKQNNFFNRSHSSLSNEILQPYPREGGDANDASLHLRRHPGEREDPAVRQSLFWQQASKTSPSSPPSSHSFFTRTFTCAAKVLVAYLAGSSVFLRGFDAPTSHLQTFSTRALGENLATRTLTHTVGQSLLQPSTWRSLGMTSLLLSQFPSVTGTTRSIASSQLPSFLVLNETSRYLSSLSPAATRDYGPQGWPGVELFNKPHEIDSLDRATARRRLQGPISEEFQISTITTGNNYNPTVAALSEGGFLVTWYNDVSPFKIWGRRYDSSGTAMGSEFQVNTNIMGDNVSPVIVAVSGGGFVVTWWNAASTSKIYGRRYDSSGTAIGPDFQINTITTGSNAGPTVAALSGGGFVVTWYNSATTSKIYGRRYDSSGTAIGPDFQINTITGSNGDPTVAALSGGGFVVTWRRADATSVKIYGRRYDSSAAAIGSDFQINTITTGYSMASSVSAFSLGGFVVVWYNDASPVKICGRLYDGTGSASANEFQINTNVGDNYNPTVATLSGGEFVVTWFNTDSKIYGRLYDSSGTALGSEFQINTNMGINNYPKVAALPGGDYVVTWQLTGSLYTTYGRLLTTNAFPTSQPSEQPSSRPSRQPSTQPTTQPSSQPTLQPSSQPIGKPSSQPSNQPTRQPSLQPNAYPTSQPSFQPSNQPSSQPTRDPSSQPSNQPTRQPVSSPSSQPTSHPSKQPSNNPSSQPSRQPFAWPTSQPSRQPFGFPSSIPSVQPNSYPTTQPTGSPSTQPSNQPSDDPTMQPTIQPSRQPTSQPSGQSTSQPSLQPIGHPTTQPTAQPSSQPTSQPSSFPTNQPSSIPTTQPSSQPSQYPTSEPTTQPSGPSSQPSLNPTFQPSGQPTLQPSSQPSVNPTLIPSAQSTGIPPSQPSSQSSLIPTGQLSDQPSVFPSVNPSTQPTIQPSLGPTSQPSVQTTLNPSSLPTTQPSSVPTVQPISQPSQYPSSEPTTQPGVNPSLNPTSQQSGQPTIQPSNEPTGQPSVNLTLVPSTQPTGIPFSQPSGQSSSIPTGQPGDQPSTFPSSGPSVQPSSHPTASPTGQPSRQPTLNPSAPPTTQPSLIPTTQPSSQSSQYAASEPTAPPSGSPSFQPSLSSTSQPSSPPTTQSSDEPTDQPAANPTLSPSTQPTKIPSSQPSGEPNSLPTTKPSDQPSAFPSLIPSTQPFNQPTLNPSSLRTIQRSSIPATQPNSQPSQYPSFAPTAPPSSIPSLHPTEEPTIQPSSYPSSQPTSQPSAQPSFNPSSRPTIQPSHRPTAQPRSNPTTQPTKDPSPLPTGQPTSSPTTKKKPLVQGWLALLGPESPLKQIISLNKQELLASGGGSSAAAFHFNASNGALLGKYPLPWDATKAAFVNPPPYSGISMLSTSLKDSSSFIANCRLATQKLQCNYIAQSKVIYESATFHPYYNLPLALGRDALNHTIATLFNPAVTSLTSFSFTIPAIQSLPLMASSSSAVTTLLAGVGTDAQQKPSIAVGILSLTPSPNIGKMVLLTPSENLTIHNKENLLNAAILTPGSLDPLVAGGIDFGNVIQPYLVRLGSSLETILCSKQFQNCGPVNDLFLVENKLYAICNALSKKGDSLQSSLKIVRINPATCEPLSSQIQITGPGNITCSNVTPTSMGFSIACNLNKNQALLFSTDKNLTFNSLPSGYRSRIQTPDLISRSLSFSLTSFLSAPLKGSYFYPATSKSSFSLVVEPFTQILPEAMAHYVPLPTIAPRIAPTALPTIYPTLLRTAAPSQTPSTQVPTHSPSISSSLRPILSSYPTSAPSSSQPTSTRRPTPDPTLLPSLLPTSQPTSFPSLQPLSFPTQNPNPTPTLIPTLTKTTRPTFHPSRIPSRRPTQRPSYQRSSRPTVLPSSLPTIFPEAVLGNASSFFTSSTKWDFSSFPKTFSNPSFFVPLIGFITANAATYFIIKARLRARNELKRRESEKRDLLHEEHLLTNSQEISAASAAFKDNSQRSNSQGSWFATSSQNDSLNSERWNFSENESSSYHSNISHFFEQSSQYSTPLPSGFEDLEDGSQGDGFELKSNSYHSENSAHSEM